MISLEEITNYIDDIIDSEAETPKEAGLVEREIAVGIIMALEDFRDWIQREWKRQL